MFAKNLLTPLGTNPLDPDDGSELPSLIGSNVTLTDARDIIVMAVAKVVDRIRTTQTTQNIPNDERLADASVIQFVDIPDGPGIAAQIYIRNVTGVGLNFLIPTLVARS
jgi:phage baseplate assembly protein W